MEHFKAAAVAADTKGDAVLRYCAVGRQLGYATYLTLDMVTFVSPEGCSLVLGVGTGGWCARGEKRGAGWRRRGG